MSEHDSWVGLRPGNPFEAISYLFPDGFPVRDPFPMKVGTAPDGKKVSLWVMDIERLDIDQCETIAATIALATGDDEDELFEAAMDEDGFFGIDDQWVNSLHLGAEGYARTLELRNFMVANPLMTPDTSLELRDFMTDQIERWVDGDEVPPPLPVSIDEVPEDLRSPELEKAIKLNNLNYRVGDGTYSVFDIFSGRAMVDILNQQSSEYTYEIIELDSLDDH